MESLGYAAYLANRETTSDVTIFLQGDPMHHLISPEWGRGAEVEGGMDFRTRLEKRKTRLRNVGPSAPRGGAAPR